MIKFTSSIAINIIIYQSVLNRLINSRFIKTHWNEKKQKWRMDWSIVTWRRWRPTAWRSGPRSYPRRRNLPRHHRRRISTPSQSLTIDSWGHSLSSHSNYSPPKRHYRLPGCDSSSLQQTPLSPELGSFSASSFLKPHERKYSAQEQTKQILKPQISRRKTGVNTSLFFFFFSGAISGKESIFRYFSWL